MRILGISGLPGAEASKRAQWPDLDEREYRITQGFDSAAVLIVDGEVVAAASEERFVGRKHTGEFPMRAIEFCLGAAQLNLDDVHEVVHSFDFAPFRQGFVRDADGARRYDEILAPNNVARQFRDHFGDSVGPKTIFASMEHHLAHAASAYYASGWTDCLVAVLDGMGEVHSASIWIGADGLLKPLRKVWATDSLGILYSLVTMHLGFDFCADEYKVMGLAPYGDRQVFREVFATLMNFGPEGHVRIPFLSRNTSPRDQATYAGSRAILSELFGPARRESDPVVQTHCDIAAGLQDAFERALLHICGHFAGVTGKRHLAMAGGCALNCVANARLGCTGVFDEIFVQPASGDDGTALGAAMLRSAASGETFPTRMPVPFWGPEYGNRDVESALQSVGKQCRIRRYDGEGPLLHASAQLVATDKVVGWFQGRAEFGPRALGARSIIANPATEGMRDQINSAVKKREGFRPFAPAVAGDDIARWFEVPAADLRYMTMTTAVRKEVLGALPAVTHIDGTARVQTVDAVDHRRFFALLCAVGEATGRRMVLNTSFNVKGQPIVNSPSQAVQTFIESGLDALVVEDFIVEKVLERTPYG